MSNELFWRYYLIFMAGILLIPIFRNIYCLCRYKMTSSKYDKYIVEIFCQNATNVCIAMHRMRFYISIIFIIPLCIFMTHSMLFSENTTNDILSYVVNLFTHIFFIVAYLEWVYGKYIITNTGILMRYARTQYVFYVLKLYDILQYDEFSYLDCPHRFLEGGKCLAISTKDMKKFILCDMKNRDEFVAILKVATGNPKNR